MPGKDATQEREKQIPAKKAATFRPSKELEEELASNSVEAPPSD